jgi:uncharacterized cupin superfamily protein
VIEGEIDCWIDGELFPMVAGDLVAWPAGTGIAHCLINNGDRDAVVLAGGESGRPGAKITYPLHPGRRADMPWSWWWDDAPVRRLGGHDGLPDAKRAPGSAAGAPRPPGGGPERP